MPYCAACGSPATALKWPEPDSKRQWNYWDGTNLNVHEALFQLNRSRHHLNKAPYFLAASMSNLNNAICCLEKYSDGEAEEINIDKAFVFFKEICDELRSRDEEKKSYYSIEKIWETRTQAFQE